jgi:hypothetical protein
MGDIMGHVYQYYVLVLTHPSPPPPPPPPLFVQAVAPLTFFSPGLMMTKELCQGCGHCCVGRRAS